MLRRIVVIALGSVAIITAFPAFSGDPQPFQDFTFKRVKVPTPGGGPLITVQIEPKADAEETEPVARVEEPQTPGAFDWYWQEISPSLAASEPGRLAQAVRHLDNGPGTAGPRLQQVQAIVGKFGPQILASTIGTNVSPALVLAVISAESSGQSGAVSAAGATGLMQLMPDTASRFGVTDATDPGENIRGGVAYLDWLMEKFDGDPILVLAGYNAGENAVRRYKGVPPYAETRAYVPKVLAAWKVARGLCLTPPEMISDGCAFGMLGTAADG